jgi:sulfite reductase alpha subunit-like flavoprotein
LLTFRIGYIERTYQVREIFFEKHFTSIFYGIRYESGDHVAVFPSNDAVLVNRIGELLNTNLDDVISLVNVDGKYRISFFYE